MPGTILCLDLSLSTGFACGSHGQRPTSGVIKLPDMSHLGRVYAALDNALADLLTVHAPALVVCEAPLRFKRQTSGELLLGLWATAQQVCYRREVRVKAVAASTARAAVLGTCRFPEGEVKDHVMAWCRTQGWTFRDDNAADALLLFANETGMHAPSRQKPARLRIAA